MFQGLPTVYVRCRGCDPDRGSRLRVSLNGGASCGGAGPARERKRVAASVFLALSAIRKLAAIGKLKPAGRSILRL